MKRNTIFEQGRNVAFVACALLIGASVIQSCKDDDLILTGQPDWLGNSIYERLQDEGNYKYTLRLIDDLDQKEVLSHTGSRTLFAANDSAFQKWFENNQWGVRSYDELKESQKKLLLYNSMIDNAYLLELLSNKKSDGDAGTPLFGRTMRRTTAASVYDSVCVMTVSGGTDTMPDNQYWAPLRAAGKSIRIMKDASDAPMIHFLPAYLNNHQMTLEDLKLLTNNRATSLDEAWVNGVKVINSGDPSRKKIDYDITCKNGYIQKVDQVIESSPNMAEIIHKYGDMEGWAHLLDRFSAPNFYQYVNGNENRDSVYVLRYLSESSYDPSTRTTRVKNNTVTYIDGTKVTVKNDNELLKFDPGWNQYVDNSTDKDLHDDAGMMIVPNNAALDEWWNTKAGDLKEEYGTLDNVPTNIIRELINVNMLSTFSSYVPSKFDAVLNDAMEQMEIKPADVEACYMGCNGVVYKVNKVFAPALFSSVAYPAVAHASTMNLIYDIIERRKFKPYLLSMDTQYALIIPTNDALKSIVDPSTYGDTNPSVYEMRWDATQPALVLDVYKSDIDEAGNLIKRAEKEETIIPKWKTENGVKVLDNDAKDTKRINTVSDLIMNQLIIILPDKKRSLEDYINGGYRYFKTKAGSLVRAEMSGSNVSFQGGYQIENNEAVTSVKMYPKDNGYSYEVNSSTILGAQNTLYTTLAAHTEFSAFRNLLENEYCDLLTESTGTNNKYRSGMKGKGSRNCRLFDNYNYTVYIPTNEKIQALVDKKILPTATELERGDEDSRLDSLCKAEGWYATKLFKDSADVRDSVAQVINAVVSNFIRYHVHDRSVAIGMAPEVDEDGNYINNSSYESMKRNEETGRFVPVKVNFDNNALTVTDNLGNDCHVVKNNGLYNIICKEYWFNTEENDRLFMASDVVIHQIDGVLMYDNLKPWRDVVKEALKLK